MFIVNSATNAVIISDVKLNDASFGLNDVTLSLDLVFFNPSDFGLNLRSVSYNVSVEGYNIASGKDISINLNPKSYTSFTVNAKLSYQQMLKAVVEAVKSGRFSVSTRVTAKSFLMLSNIVMLPLSSNFVSEATKSVYVPSKPSPVTVNAYWLDENIHFGEPAKFIVKVPTGNLTIYIVQERVGSPDKIIAVYYGSGLVSGEFRPPEPSGGDVVGYYIRVVLEDGVVWDQPSGYPPRLKAE